jgi:superfamily I DNA/RNA helicase
VPPETPVKYVLHRPGRTRAVAPDLDDSQRAVLEHFSQGPRGPLQVLAGPGAGKTTTLVELVVDQVENGGLKPEEILVLTFSRKAAQELRARIARRLERTTATAPAMTFHSFCYALLRAEQPAESFLQPIRLLSAPDFDAAIAELLGGTDPELWPAVLRPALKTRGMASELRTFLASARALGMDAVDVERVAGQVDRPDWLAAGRFFDELTSVAALENTIDHTDLIFQAVRLLADPEVRHRWRSKLKLIVVDEYQDTDPLQVDLLRALAAAKDLVVVGDPYQSIYGFRGADVRGILDFPDAFATAAGPAPRITLSHTNRYGPVIAGAVRSIVENKGAVAAADGRALAVLRNPESRATTAGDVAVQTFSSAAAEAEHIALLLREAHLHDGVPWHDMAVLVRTGVQLGRVQRALSAAGVPVNVAGDEVPLAVESAVRTLLAALHAADDLSRGETLGPDVAEALLTGPLGHLDAGGLRRLGRVLRKADVADSPGAQPRASRLLIAEALGDPVFLETQQADGPNGWAVAAAGRLARLLQKAATQIRDGEPAEQVLWTLWDGTPWPRRLRGEAEGAGDGAERANHDLDAVVALFDEAARAEERMAHRAVTEIARALEAQQIPADTLAQASDTGEAVHLMTAHRSKGLEWRVVVVAGVQDGLWPDVRSRGSLLQSDRLAPDGVQAPPTAATAAAEERRLFYVACSRAREHLVVTAVASGSDDGDQPSRFVTELATHVHGAVPTARHRPNRSLSLRGTVAELRRIGEQTDDAAVRDHVAALLARIARHPAGRVAHPDRWWGLSERTTNETPVRPLDQPLRLSGSQVSSLTDCPLRWFLGHEVRGGMGTSAAQGFGSIVHALAADTARRGVVPDPEQMAERLDDVWDALGYPDWISARERAAARLALARYAQWHGANDRALVAVEHPFDVTVEVEGRTVQISGKFDRVEQSDHGIHVVDLKTSKRKADGIEEHAQLGTYQVAIDAGAASDLVDGGAAGAELVQLRNDADSRSPGVPLVQSQPGPVSDEPFFALDQLRRAVRHIAEENFAATENSHCKYCEFRALCPTTDAGSTILTGREEGSA